MRSPATPLLPETESAGIEGARPAVPACILRSRTTSGGRVPRHTALRQAAASRTSGTGLRHREELHEPDTHTAADVGRRAPFGREAVRTIRVPGFSPTARTPQFP